MEWDELIIIQSDEMVSILRDFYFNAKNANPAKSVDELRPVVMHQLCQVINKMHARFSPDIGLRSFVDKVLKDLPLPPLPTKMSTPPNTQGNSEG